MTLSALPALALTRAVAKSRPWIDLDHFSLAAYASMEPFQQRIVVVDPTVTEPTLLLRAGTRVPRRSNTYAVLVPTLDHLTVALAQQVTGMLTTYFGLRCITRQQRQANDLSPYRMTPARHVFA